MKHEIVLYHVEHTAQQITNTGIQRVVRGLAKALIQEGKTLIPVRFENGRFFTIDEQGLEIISFFNGPSAESWGNLSELQQLVPQAKALIVPELFTPASRLREMVAFCKKNNIVSSAIFHDAIPTLMPGWYKDGAIAHKEYMQTLALCDHIFSVSNSSANDFRLLALDVYGQHLPKVHTVYLPNVFLDFPKIKEKENNTKDIEIVCVSTVEVRKNHITLLKAFIKSSDLLIKEGYNLKLNLVGTGSKWWQATMAVESLMSGRKNIFWHKNANDDELVKFYESADFSIYPSIYEGYGLPISESLYLNTPVICSSTSSMSEIASQGGCLTFDPYDVEELVNKIMMMAKDAGLRKQKVEEASLIKMKSWEKYSNEIMSILEGGKK